jgi:hypothetical protein
VTLAKIAVGASTTSSSDAAIFRNRSGALYSKDTLGDDFLDIRETRLRLR